MQQSSETLRTPPDMTCVTEQAGTRGQCSNRRCQQGCTLPYSYAARPRFPRDSDELIPCYLSDSLCGLLNFLRKESIDFSDLEFINLSGVQPDPVNARLYQIIDGRWQDKAEHNRVPYQA